MRLRRPSRQKGLKWSFIVTVIKSITSVLLIATVGLNFWIFGPSFGVGHSSHLPSWLVLSRHAWQNVDLSTFMSDFSGPSNKRKQQHDFLFDSYDVCIVGAGLTGAILAEQYANKLMAKVLLLDKRHHIGGNLYDYTDADTQLRVHSYGGPYVFHTNNKTIWKFLQLYGTSTNWPQYQHRQVARVQQGKTVPVPLNMESVNTLFGLTMTKPQEIQEWLQKQIDITNTDTRSDSATNAKQAILARFGQDLYDTFYKPYLMQHWHQDPSQLLPTAINNTLLHLDFENRYYLDTYQALPATGYTAMFQQMLSSPLIRVQLKTLYTAELKSRLQCGKTIFTGPVDSYPFDNGASPLPHLEYQSLSWERFVQKNVQEQQTHAIVDYLDDEENPFRMIEFKHFPYNAELNSPHTLYVKEHTQIVTTAEEQKGVQNVFYPVPTLRNREIYEKTYKPLIEQEEQKGTVRFLGGLAHYESLQIDETISQALQAFEDDTGVTAFSPARPKMTNIEIQQALVTDIRSQFFGGTLLREHGNIVSYAGKLDHYSNAPPVTQKEKRLRQRQMYKALTRPVSKPLGLKHKAHPPGQDLVMGMANQDPQNMKRFRLFVGSLRASGYDGHIILGVHRDIGFGDEDYLKAMDVTYYAVEPVDCDPAVTDHQDPSIPCTRGAERFPENWARFELARQWLHECSECTGWTLFADVATMFFQENPFASLPDTSEDSLLLVEHIAPHTNPQPERLIRADTIGDSRYTWRTENCYGARHFVSYYNRPLLSSGAVLGTRKGMHRFLSVVVDEFDQNNQKPNAMCRLPQNVDQFIVNYLYYTGRFGLFSQTKTLPWGTGPVGVLGTPCYDREKDGAQKHSRADLILFDDQERILNIHERGDSKARIVAVLYEYDRCNNWVTPWLEKRPELSQKQGHEYIRVEELTLPWKRLAINTH